MEGKDVYKISIMAAIAADLLAGGDPGFASFPDRLAIDASVEVDRHHVGCLFPVHQGFVHASCQSARRLIPYSCFRASTGLAEAARMAL